MKKKILIYGLLAGLIVSAMLVITCIRCYYEKDFSGSMIVGFTVMILAFAFIFIGIKNYRDQFNNGTVTFGKAISIGLYITLIASTMYVVVWLISFYGFIPDYMDKYTEHVINNAKANGVSKADLAKQVAEMQDYKDMYSSPVGVVLLTYLEILPVGLIITLLSALVLKRKQAKIA